MRDFGYDVVNYLLNAQGDLVARAQYDRYSGRWTLWLKEASGWRANHSEVAPVDYPKLVGLSRDDQSVLVRTYGADGWSLHQASLVDGAWTDLPSQLGDGGVIDDPRSHKPIGFQRTGLDHTTYRFDAPADQSAWDAVERAFPDEEVRIASWSDDRSKVVVLIEGAQHGAAYFLVDLKKMTADWIADEYVGVPVEAIAAKRVIHYAAADGFEAPAYLTLPRGASAKAALPLVVLVHGGPRRS